MRAPRTCLICGGPTGSREHVFPAALGGRRTNKGIYCGPHNGDYSPLAAVLASQLQAINAFLGVRGDHADAPHSVALTERDSGRTYRFSGGKVEMEPEVVSESQDELGATVTTMAFSSERQFRAFLEARRQAGQPIGGFTRSEPQQRFLGPSQVRLELGGPDGLRAVAYVAQTFLAHHFPLAARLPELRPFLLGTLNASDWTEDAWWTAEPDSADLPPQPFAFRHRVLVGLDAATQSAYARVSLFSGLHFAVLFGRALIESSQTVVVDIDPLAEHPPDDISARTFAAALAPVRRPANLTAELAQGIHSGRSQADFNALMARIAERDLSLTVNDMLAEFEPAASLDAYEREQLFARVIHRQSQRVLNLTRHVLGELPARAPELAALWPSLHRLMEFDPASPSGLTPIATAFLELAKLALVQQMLADHAAGRLDRERVASLIAGGDGAVIAGRAVLQTLLDRQFRSP